MLALVCGLATALLWGSSMVVASRSSRRLGSQPALAYNMMVSLPLAAALSAIGGVPHGLHHGAVAWAVLGGVASVVGASMTYRALRIGKIGVVAPIVSTEGALAATFSVVLFGEALSPAVAATLAIIAAGVVIVTFHARARDIHLRPTLYALAAAAAFGIGLVAVSRATIDLGPFWTSLVARTIGVLGIAVPVLLRGNLPAPGSAWWMVTFSGVADLGGFVSFMIGSRYGVAVVAVLASQTATIATLLSFLILGERLTVRQAAGMVVILAGVTALAVLQT